MRSFIFALGRPLKDMSADDLRRLWEEGIASGPGRFKSIDEIKTEARRRTADAARAHDEQA
jgi:antitoxin ParD1/3/4